MIKVFIGIDPGVNGCISVFCGDSEVVNSHMMPKIKGKEEIDGEELGRLLRMMTKDVDFHIMVEDVHAIFGAAAGTTFSFGYNVGLLHGVLMDNSLPYTLVQPKRWQKEMWQGLPLIRKKSKTGKTMVTDTKAMSIAAAQKLFPSADLRKSKRARVPHDGVADSVLLAECCRRVSK